MCILHNTLDINCIPRNWYDISSQLRQQLQTNELYQRGQLQPVMHHRLLGAPVGEWCMAKPTPCPCHAKNPPPLPVALVNHEQPKRFEKVAQPQPGGRDGKPTEWNKNSGKTPRTAFSESRNNQRNLGIQRNHWIIRRNYQTDEAMKISKPSSSVGSPQQPRSAWEKSGIRHTPRNWRKPICKLM